MKVLSTLVPLAALALAASAQNYSDTNSQNGNGGDPPNRVARVSVVQGNVSLEPAGVDAFSAAELNYPLTAGDRVYADNNALTELQTSGLALRLANGADLTVTSLTDSVAQFGLAQGSVRLRTRDLYAPEGSTAVVEIDTPNGAILVERPGDIRVDSYPQDDTTVVTVTSGQVEITGAGLDQQVGPNESLRLAGNPVYAERMQVLPPDQLDQFDSRRERDRQQALAVTAQYADPNMIGVADLSQYGDWNPGPADGGGGDYGAVWFPRNVAADWTPYSNGHWAWVAPWGWTWVEAEPWGFAPFHYGRWASFGGRWGWIPGPPPAAFAGGGGGYARPIRPVYSPALVAFVGGPRLSISIGFGGSSGAGVTAWFPLGPHEAYTPWYHASPGYVNRVNVTNIYNRNVNEVHNTYINRTTNVYNTNVTNVTYVNRQQATIAVSQRDFAGGRSVAQAQPVRLDAGQRQQLNQAPVLPHPLVTPAVSMAAPQAPARAVPPRDERPVVESQRGAFAGQGGDRGFNRGGSLATQPANLNQPRPVATTPTQQQTFPQQNTGVQPNQPRQVVQPGPAAGGARSNIYDPHEVSERAPAAQQPAPAGAVRGAFPQQRTPQPVAAAPVVSTPAAPATTPAAPGRPGVNTPNRPVVAPIPAASVQAPPQYGRPGQNQPAAVQGRPGISAPQQMPAVQTLPARPLPRPADQPRALVNRTEPQTPQPSFAQQQRAIERTDPGRPLGPQQVENVRNNRPAGAAAQAEPVAHPAATAPPPPGRPGKPQPAAPVKPTDPKQKPQ